MLASGPGFASALLFGLSKVFVSLGLSCPRLSSGKFYLGWRCTHDLLGLDSVSTGISHRSSADRLLLSQNPACGGHDTEPQMNMSFSSFFPRTELPPGADPASGRLHLLREYGQASGGWPGCGSGSEAPGARGLLGSSGPSPQHPLPQTRTGGVGEGAPMRIRLGPPPHPTGGFYFKL